MAGSGVVREDAPVVQPCAVRETENWSSWAVQFRVRPHTTLQEISAGILLLLTVDMAALLANQEGDFARDGWRLHPDQ